MSQEELVVHGAREHNLKDVTVRLPRNALVCITGLSGSGKSSLAFDTIYAEGQRRYVESLSAYARQFLQMMEKPDVDSIEGLSPAISIDQKTTSRNPRSTVGTVTEIYDYLRLLYARIGKPHCPICGRPISGQSQESIVDQILQLEPGTRFTVNAPVVRDRKGEYKDVFEHLQAEGFSRVKVDGDQRLLEEGVPELDKKFKHTIEVVVDRLVIKDDLRTRLAQSVETAAQLADGLVVIDVVDGAELTFSEKFACPEHGVSLPELQPRIFSFNSPHGACPSPGQRGPAPWGEWNEKMRGCSSGSETPCSGQANFSLNVSSAPSTTSITTRPSASCAAVSTDWASRVRRSSLITSRSTTTSIVCLNFLSNSGTPSSS